MDKIAFISVFNKEGIDQFAKDLVGLSWSIMSSSGTAKYLKDKGIECMDLADIVGSPILGHRVVSLSREFYAMLLARPDNTEDVEELKKLNLPFISLVCCDMYPLEEEVARPDATATSVIEKTDIGGPTMLRAAAKGRRIVISDKNDRQMVINWLTEGEKDRDVFLNNLAAKAEITISRYCALSAGYHSKGSYKGLTLSRVSECAYGENAWQGEAYLNKRLGNTDPLALYNWRHIAGNAPSYNNWCDIDRMIQTMTHIGAGFEKNFKKVPAIALGVKHGNACGSAFAEDPIQAVGKMLEGDVRAIFGGSVMLNFPVDAQLAEALIHLHSPEGVRRLLDVVSAPSFTEEAIEILSRKKGKCRLLINQKIEKAGLSSLDKAKRYRYVRGGFLEQANYTFVPELSDENLVLAWGVGSTSNSNTIAIVKDGKLVGNGVGQQDRVGAAKLAIARADDAAHSLNGSAQADLALAVAYSDSFFPFPDAPEVLADRGINKIFSTSGSVNDEKILEICKNKGVELVLIPDKEARGFAWH